MEFRKDINGLRAIAVLAVIIFHFNKEWLPGGFVGVDVFFAISGFLMTSIIFCGVAEGNFSIFNFIKRRAKRIVPPLIIVILLSVSFGYLVLEPITYQMAGKHGLYSLLFLSNHVYNGESGYFDAAAPSKIFLHTWSLSVEWQFYILYPIVIYCMSRLFKVTTLKTLIVISFLCFFLASVFYTKTEPTSAYFMLYSRAWEMIAGGIAFIYPLNATEKTRKKYEYAGLFIIFLSCVIYTERTPWPGHYALLTIFGAFLCLSANSKSSLLNNKFLQHVGTWSYSLYLVHWPILAISRNIGFDYSIVTYLLITFAFGFLSYRLIESNLRKWHYYLPVYAATLYVCYFVSIDGISNRVELKFQLTAYQYHKKYYGGSGFLTDGTIQYVNTNGDDADFIIEGDSYSRQYLRYLKDAKYKFIAVMNDGCYSSENYMTRKDAITDKQCSDRYKNFLAVLKKYPQKPVVMAQAWGTYENRLTPTNDSVGQYVESDYYKILNKEIGILLAKDAKPRNYYIIGSNFNTIGSAVYECLAKTSMNNWFVKTFMSDCDNVPTIVPDDVNSNMKAITDNYKNLTFIDPNTPLCKEGHCKSLTNDREPVLSDGSHLSYYGSLLIGNFIFSQIK